MANRVETFRVELANKFVRGRAVGNLYGVARLVDGRRTCWTLLPQESEALARRVVAGGADLLQRVRELEASHTKLKSGTPERASSYKVLSAATDALREAHPEVWEAYLLELSRLEDAELARRGLAAE